MSLGSFFKQAYPWLATAASIGGGPAGTFAANIVGQKLGITNLKPENLEATINNAFASPEQRLKLEQAENEFKLQMEKLGIDSAVRLEEIASADRASARAREIAIKDKLPAILAISITAGFFTLLILLVFATIPAGSQTILNIMVGSLGTAWIGIVNYYFGSSSGSADKSRTIAGLAEEKK